jgi:hypothetical protein
MLFVYLAASTNVQVLCLWGACAANRSNMQHKYNLLGYNAV